MKLGRTLTFIVMLTLSSIGCANQPTTNSGEKAVLVTGASSGIGRQIAFTLADHGFFVYAGARKTEDIRELSAHPKMQGIRLDVTKQQQIDAAVKTIRMQGRGLYGLVNNAGIFLFDPMIEVSERDMQFMMDVNLFGPYRVTKAFAPLIIEGKGRITTTGSIAGISSGTFMGPYSMSKHAIEAFTDSLAAEMAKFDVQVSVIEPGNFRSNIMKNMYERYEALGIDKSDSMYTAEIERFMSFAKADRSNHLAPIPVAEAVLDFMSSDATKRRYMVTPNAGEARFTIQNAIQRAIELNHDHAHTLSLEELNKILVQSVNAIDQSSSN